MTIKQFLALSEEEQAIEAAKVLTDKPWWHKITNAAESTGECWCSKCEEWFLAKTTDDFNKCPVPDPITIDWGTAKRLQGEVLGNDSSLCTTLDVCKADTEFCKHLAHIYKIENNALTFSEWQRTFCSPLDWIAACMMIKGKLE